MKSFFVPFFTLATCVIASAQTASETHTWINNFCSQHVDCIKRGEANITSDMLSKAGTYFFETKQIDFISDDEEHYTLYDLSTVTSVKVWTAGDHSFVRLVANSKSCQRSSRNCAGYVPFTPGGTADIYLQQGSTKEDTQRLVNAIVHLAELNGAKPNSKDIF